MFKLLKLLKLLSPVKLYVSNNCNAVAFEIANKGKKKVERKIPHHNQSAEEITSISPLKREVLSRRSAGQLDCSLVNDKVKGEPEDGWRHVRVHL